MPYREVVSEEQFVDDVTDAEDDRPVHIAAVLLRQFVHLVDQGSHRAHHLFLHHISAHAEVAQSVYGVATLVAPRLFLGEDDPSLVDALEDAVDRVVWSTSEYFS